MESETKEELTNMLGTALAMLAVTAQVVEVLITSHPDPKRVQSAWHAQRLESVDAEMGTPPFAVEAYREAFVGNMEGLSRLIDAAAAG
jgi:hypothetical protein